MSELDPRHFSSFDELSRHHNKKSARKLKIRQLLRFKDSALEKEYQSCRKSIQLENLLAILLFYLLFCSVSYCFNESDKSAFLIAWDVLNLFLLIVTLIITSIKKQKLPLQISIIIAQTYVIVSWIEGLRMSQRSWSDSNYLISGLIIELVLLNAVLAKCSWVLCAAFSFIISVYSQHRIPVLGENNESLGLRISICMLNALFISVWAFKRERDSRESYYKKKMLEKALIQYEDIIKEIIPSAIVIVRQEEIVFYNEETSKLLQIHSKSELEDRFKDIVMEEKHEPSDMKNELKHEYHQVNIKTDSEFLTLFDLILLHKLGSKHKKAFDSYTGTRTPLNRFELSDNLPNCLDIKIGYLSWQGAEAFMIVLAEDHATEKLNFLARQSQYKDDLLATVSHDLRSPLNGIIGIIETVMESIKGELRKSLDLALCSSRLMLFLINDILDFSQISHGKLRVQPVKFDIIEIIQDVSKLVKFQAGKKGLDFEFLNLLQPSDSCVMHNDPNRLKQIILNLLSNALKFTEKGSIKVTVEPHSSPSKSPHLCAAKISVQDTGCGIKEEDLPRLFSMFGKLEESKRLNSQGIGLGLAISQNLVRLMNLNLPGEEIKVRSEYGKGSLFSFNLHSMPFEEELRKPKKKLIASQILKELSEMNIGPSERDIREPPMTTPKSVFSRSHKEKYFKRILLVDDDQINITVLKMYLALLPELAYDLAFNGKQALEAVVEAASKGVYYDIILMDCNMPIMDGYEAAERILSLQQDKTIPTAHIIALTANNSEEELERCLKIGMAGCWRKPISKLEFNSKLTKHLDKLSAEKQTANELLTKETI